MHDSLYSLKIPNSWFFWALGLKIKKNNKLLTWLSCFIKMSSIIANLIKSKRELIFVQIFKLLMMSVLNKTAVRVRYDYIHKEHVLLIIKKGFNTHRNKYDTKRQITHSAWKTGFGSEVKNLFVIKSIIAINYVRPEKYNFQDPDKNTFKTWMIRSIFNKQHNLEILDTDASKENPL